MQDESGKMAEDFWGPSVKMVGESDFLRSLQTFDKDWKRAWGPKIGRKSCVFHRNGCFFFFSPMFFGHFKAYNVPFSNVLYGKTGES